MLTGHEMSILSDIVPLSREMAIDNNSAHLMRLEEGIRKGFNIAQGHSQMSYGKKAVLR